MSPLQRRRPLYSACNEDTRSEIRALDVGPADTVVAISSGGGRALSLLTAGPHRVVALDYQLDQLYSLDLKCAAMQEMAYERYRGFVGLDPCLDRLELYEGIRRSLTQSARSYWDRRTAMIEHGILYCGRFERTLSTYTSALRAIGMFRFPSRYFAATTLEDQAILLQRDETRFDRGVRFWKLFCNPLVAYLIMQDPGFLRTTEGNVGRYLWQRLRSFGERHLFRDSFLLHLIYFGSYASTGPLPLYLTETGFDLAKKHLARLETRHERLEATVQRPPGGSILKWSLSDTSCWMSNSRFGQTLVALVDAANEGDRFCFRNFAARRRLPDEILSRVDPLADLCRELDRDDSSVFFRFQAGVVRHGSSWRGGKCAMVDP